MGIFIAKVWKQGNSLVITIPIEIIQNYNVKKNDIIELQFIRTYDKTEEPSFYI